MRRVLSTKLLECTRIHTAHVHARCISHATQWSPTRVTLTCGHQYNTISKRHFHDFDNLPENERMYMFEVTEGNAKYQEEKLTEALEHYSKALKYRPGDPTALLNRAAIVQSLGNDDEAIKDLQTIITQMEKIDFPEHFKIQTSTAYLRLGELMVEKNQYKEAVKYLRRANELEPSASTEALLRETQAYAKPDHVVVTSYTDDEKYFKELTKGMDIEIRKSPVHGRGLFATKDFEEGEVIFTAPSYVTAPVEDVRDQHENKQKKERGKDKERDNILPDVLANEGICFHCIRPLPNAVIEDYDKMLTDYEIKRKFNLTEDKALKVRDEINKFLGMESDDVTPLKMGDQIFCSKACKDHAVQNYGKVLEQPKAFKQALQVDEESQDATILMAKVLAKLDADLPPGKPFALGRDLKRLSSCPNPEIVPDLEKQRYEALKAMFKRELTLDIFMRIRTLLNFNCFGVETCQYYFKLGAPDAAQAQSTGVSYPKTKEEGENEEEPNEADDIPLTSQHVAAVDGASLNLVGSFLNHSCEANVMMVEAMSHAGVIPYVASTAIAKGQELFWCYAGKGQDGETRRKMLFLQYKFGCKCSLCAKEFQGKIANVARGNIADR